MRRLAESVGQTVKDTMQPEEPNPENAVALAMQKAAEQMVLDYNDLVRLVDNAWFYQACQGEIKLTWP